MNSLDSFVEESLLSVCDYYLLLSFHLNQLTLNNILLPHQFAFTFYTNYANSKIPISINNSDLCKLEINSDVFR